MRRLRSDHPGHDPALGQDVHPLRQEDVSPPAPEGHEPEPPLGTDRLHHEPDLVEMRVEDDPRSATGSFALADEAPETVVRHASHPIEGLAHDAPDSVLGAGSPRGERQPTQELLRFASQHGGVRP